MQEDWYCEHGYCKGDGCPDCDVPSHLPAVLQKKRAACVVPYQAEAGITVMGRGGTVAYLPQAFTMREAQQMCDRVNGGERASEVFPSFSRPAYCTAEKIDGRAS